MQTVLVMIKTWYKIIGFLYNMRDHTFILPLFMASAITMYLHQDVFVTAILTASASELHLIYKCIFNRLCHKAY